MPFCDTTLQKKFTQFGFAVIFIVLALDITIVVKYLISVRQVPERGCGGLPETNQCFPVKICLSLSNAYLVSCPTGWSLDFFLTTKITEGESTAMYLYPVPDVLTKLSVCCKGPDWLIDAAQGKWWSGALSANMKMVCCISSLQQENLKQISKRT